MTFFETVKNSVTVKQAAELYGYTRLFRDRGVCAPSNISVFSGDSLRTYRETRRKGGGTELLYVRTQQMALLPHILRWRFVVLMWSFSF